MDIAAWLEDRQAAARCGCEATGVRPGELARSLSAVVSVDLRKREGRFASSFTIASVSTKTRMFEDSSSLWSAAGERFQRHFA
jgi:hypothetical protein